MPTFHFTSPEGKEYEIEGPEGATQEQAFSVLQTQLGAKPTTTKAKTAEDVYKEVATKSKPFDTGGLKNVVGAAETGLGMATGLFGSAVGGVVGAGRALYSLAKGEGPETAGGKGAETSEATQHALTYEPKTEAGKKISGMASLPMEVAKSLSKKAGGAAGVAGGGEFSKAEAAGEAVGEVAPEVIATLLGGRAAMAPVKAAEAMPGKTVSPLRKMTPEQEGRFFRMKEQGIEPTLGQVTREPAQVRYEQQTAQLPEGARIAQRFKEQDVGLTSAIEKIKEGPEAPGVAGPPRPIAGAKGLSEIETGRTVRSALESKAAAKMQEVNAKYTQARAAGETKSLVDVSPLVAWLEKNEPASIAVKELRSITSGLRKLVGEEPEAATPTSLGSGKISGRITKKPEEVAKEPPKVTIDDLEYLRQEAGKLQQRDGSAKAYMSDVRKIIDEMTEGKGGDLYKEARKARKEWGDEFEERLGVAGIIEKKTRSDYKTAVEDVWNKSVIGGSIEDLGNVVESLRSSTGKQKEASAQALKEMQARTVDHLVEKATETGTFSPAAFKKAVKNIGSEKLDLLLGRNALDSLTKTMESARDVKTQPVRAPGSDTYLNQKTMAQRIASEHAEHLLKGIMPRFAGRILDSIKARAEERAGKMRTEQAVEESLTPRRAPLQEVAEQAATARKERRGYLMSEAAKRSAAQIPAATGLEENR